MSDGITDAGRGYQHYMLGPKPKRRKKSVATDQLVSYLSQLLAKPSTQLGRIVSALDEADPTLANLLRVARLETQLANEKVAAAWPELRRKVGLG